jgi:hypothetical protein
MRTEVQAGSEAVDRLPAEPWAWLCGGLGGRPHARVVLAARCRRPGSTLAGCGPGADNGTREARRRPKRRHSRGKNDNACATDPEGAGQV